MYKKQYDYYTLFQLQVHPLHLMFGNIKKNGNNAMLIFLQDDLCKKRCDNFSRFQPKYDFIATIRFSLCKIDH